VNNNVDYYNYPLEDTDPNYSEDKDLTGYNTVYFASFSMSVITTRTYGFCVNKCPEGDTTKE